MTEPDSLARASAANASAGGALDHMSGMVVFTRAAETLSFAEAGRQLGLSASAIGKAIARLETRLAVRLFHRSTRSVRLTNEGELFLARCQRILGEIEEAEAELALSRTTPTGRLRVSIPLVGTLLMPVLSGFMRRYPGVQLDIDFSDRIVDVIEDGFDVVLRTGDALDSQLTMRTLGHYTHVIVASPAYLAQHGTPAQPEDLVTHACLQHRFSRTGRLRRWAFVRDGVPVEVELPSTAVASAVEPLIALAEQGLGFTNAPDFAVRAQLAEGSLVIVLSDFLHDRIPFRALWPSGRMTPPKVRAFVDFLSATLFPE
ncbi:LysR family transcriptional regulator [Caballeronia sp. LZ035]|uniref:LysR family transcriptional regulator n=1 Tax=Caballeronia sp. LZ035 TaxID=3038568 RepID=UPI00285F7D91|nr:LysR family transcriptional regulator [Caballeronia sp. LZ035]MDR5761324.1 LysR family transcriptional regulator [Caballeronia sp. LZ035]